MTLFTRFGARRVMFTSVVAAASVALVLSGCSGGTATPEATTGASEAPESTVDPFAPEVDTVKAVQYKQTSAAPWFAAITAGYPEEYGITLTTDYGENYWTDRSYGARDPEGHMWWFMQRLKTAGA